MKYVFFLNRPVILAGMGRDKAQGLDLASLRRSEVMLVLSPKGWGRLLAPAAPFLFGATIGCLTLLDSSHPTVLGRLEHGGVVALLFAGIGLLGLRYVWAYRVWLGVTEVTVFNGFWYHSVAWERITSCELKCEGGEGASMKMHLLDRHGDTLAKLDMAMLTPYRETLKGTIEAALKDQ